jgi:TonB family protein
MRMKFLWVFIIAVPASAGDWYATTVESLTYPLLGNQAKIEGKVQLTLTIAPDGRVTQADVVSGNPVLARDAKSNALTLRFTAPCKDDKSAPRTIEFTYEFRLVGETEQRPSTSVHYEHPYKMLVVSQTQHWNPSTAKGK